MMTEDELRRRITDALLCGTQIDELASEAGFKDADSLRRFLRDRSRNISKEKKCRLEELVTGVPVKRPKTKSNRKPKTSTTNSSRPEADAITEWIKRELGYKYTNDTSLVMARYFLHVALTEGFNKMGLSRFDSDVEKEANNG